MNKKSNELIWSVIGGGNGGQALAGHLALQGCTVRLYDIIEEKIEVINKQGGIFIDGVMEGFGQLEFATSNIKKAVEGADVLVITTPANAHKILAKECAPLLVDGQKIILHPGSTFGVLEFKNVLDNEGCTADIILGETYSLLYAARSKEYGKASILGIKKSLGIAAFPATKTNELMEVVKDPLPMIVPMKNVLETSLMNVNAVVHPGPTLLNTSRIDSKEDWLYYVDGYTPGIGDFVDRYDQERIRIGKVLSLELDTMVDVYKNMYPNIVGNNIAEVVNNNPAYAEVTGQKSLDTRYLWEDIPFGVIPLVSLGKMLGVDVGMMETVCNLGEYLLDRDLTSNARTVENLGIDGLSAEDLVEYVETGFKPVPVYN